MPYFLPGTRIFGNFEVDSKPLMGSMGVVYLCEDIQNHIPVALKTFKPEFLPDRETREKFINEGIRWMNLGRHPNIVTCFKVERGNDGTEIYLLLELISKQDGMRDASLRSMLSTGKPISPEQVLLFGLQIARGMEFATRMIPGLVHRDLKPENILAGRDKLPGSDCCRLRVTDFGLASIIADRLIKKNSDEVTSAHYQSNPYGSLFYIAPERWNGDDCDLRSDVYSLGCILLEMLTGKPPVNSPDLDRDEIETAHCFGHLAPLPEQLASAIKSLVTRCLMVKPEARFGTWRELEISISSVYRQLYDRNVPTDAGETGIKRSENLEIGWGLSNLGASCMDIGQIKKAFSCFDQARSIGEKENDVGLQAAGLDHMGIACFAQSNFNEAIVHFQKALALYKSIDDKEGQGNALGNLGNVYIEKGEYESGIEFLNRKLEIYREEKDDRGMSSAISDLGIAYSNIGRPRDAISCFMKSLEYSRLVGDKSAESSILLNLGSVFTHIGEFDLAENAFKQDLAISTQIADYRGQNSAYGSFGNLYFMKGDSRQAIEYYEKALKISREIGDRLSEHNSLVGIGDGLVRLGEMSSGLEYLQQALALATEMDSKMAQARVMGNIGIAYDHMGKSSKAIECHEKQYQMSIAAGALIEEADSLANLGKIYARQGEQKKASEYLEKALAIYRSAGYLPAQMTALGNLGLAHFVSKEYAQAIDYYEQSLNIARQLKNVHGEAISLSGLADAFRDTWEIEKATDCYTKSIAQYKDVGDLEGEGIALFNYVDLLINTHREKDALPLAQKASRIFCRLGRLDYFRKAQTMLSFLRRNIVSDEDEADDVDDYEKMGILLDAEEITNKFYSNAVIANYFPIIFAVAQAVNGSERSRKALEKDLPEIEMVSPELQKSIWKIIDGSRNRKDIVAGLDQVSRTVVKEILEILSYQGL